MKGPETLSDSELLAILIVNGTRSKTALDLAKEILSLGKNNLPELGRITVKQMMKVKGIGEAKAISIVAALEIGRRRQALASLEKQIVTTSADVAKYLQTLLQDNLHEVFAVLFLNQANKINHLK